MALAAEGDSRLAGCLVSTPTVRAAGGVLWRIAPDGDGESVEVALIHRPRYDDWSLPKGKLSAGESEVDGAIREVLEETGFRPKLGRSLGETRYMKEQDGIRVPKVVRWWAMEALGGRFTPGREVDALEWVTIAQAHEQVTRDTDRDVLERFVRGSAPARMILLVRHARAGDRTRWSGDDAERPLDACGRAQASALVRFLTHFEPGRIVSADNARCTQTVEPLSRSIGLPIEQDPILSETTYPGREDEAIHFVRQVDGNDGAVVLCTQGGVIPDLVQRLADADDVDIDDIPPRKASTWALTFQADRMVAAEYFAPPVVAECG